MRLVDRTKFLEGYAQNAARLVEPLVMELIAYGSRRAVHIVILDPRKQYAPGVDLPVLFEGTIGEQDSKVWERPFDEIARAKARVCWRTGMSSRTVGECAPYLYEPGDTKFPGGVVCDKLIVAVSGLEWQFDEAVAHSVIGLFWAGVRAAREAAMLNGNQIAVC